MRALFELAGRAVLESHFLHTEDQVGADPTIGTEHEPDGTARGLHPFIDAVRFRDASPVNCVCGGMEDTIDLGSIAYSVGVRVPPDAPNKEVDEDD